MYQFVFTYLFNLEQFIKQEYPNSLNT